MKEELLAELAGEELAAPEYYPIEYALMWVAYGNKPINQDYAKIIYDEPPKYITTLLKGAEAKLLTYLRSGKISARTMGYKKNKEGNYVRTGKHEPLDRESWKGQFNWDTASLHYSDAKGVWYECTDIIVNTNELLKCEPISKKIETKNDLSKSQPKSLDKPLHLKEKETLLKMVIGMAIDGYGYDPTASRSPIPALISDILAEQGMSLDVDTVRRWLKQAAEFRPQKLKKAKE